ncbi:hypothetical protein niasHS_016450 [Heterodera schachtii]|uniref:Uncharacterized protein n=1 Tax=Heterodera schachtii TaxID=97005 RepID=A0ABD2HMZ8_HETSC
MGPFFSFEVAALGVGVVHFPRNSKGIGPFLDFEVAATRANLKNGQTYGAKANEARKKKRANQTSSKKSETTKKILCTHKPRAVLEKQKQQQRQKQHTIPAEPVPNENATNEQQPNNTNNNTNNGTVKQQPLQHQPNGNNLPPMPNINNNNNGTNPQIASPNRLNFEGDDEQQPEDNESGQIDESELGQDDESVELGHNNGNPQLDEVMPAEDNKDESEEEAEENDMANQQQQQAQTDGAEMPMEVPDEPCYELSSILAVFTDGKGDRAYFVKWNGGSFWGFSLGWVLMGSSHIHPNWGEAEFTCNGCRMQDSPLPAYRNLEWVLGTDMFGLEMAVDFTGTSSAICTMDALEGKPVPKTHLHFLLGNQQFRRLAARLNANPTETKRDIMWAYKITSTQKKSAEKQLEAFIRRFMQ